MTYLKHVLTPLPLHRYFWSHMPAKKKKNNNFFQCFRFVVVGCCVWGNKTQVNLYQLIAQYKYLRLCTLFRKFQNHHTGIQIYQISEVICIKCLDNKTIESELCQRSDTHCGLQRAVDQHSDLVPNVYEGRCLRETLSSCLYLLMYYFMFHLLLLKASVWLIFLDLNILSKMLDLVERTLKFWLFVCEYEKNNFFNCLYYWIIRLCARLIM